MLKLKIDQTTIEMSYQVTVGIQALTSIVSRTSLAPKKYLQID